MRAASARLRAALATVLATAAAASLADECMKGLRVLESANDVELVASCRAAFTPELCTQARESLGVQPWTAARKEASCARFAYAYEGMDSRALEAAVKQKQATTPQEIAPVPQMDASLRQKSLDVAAPPRFRPAAKPVAPEQAPIVAEKVPEPTGPVAGLLKKLKKLKDAKEAHEKEAKAAVETSGQKTQKAQKEEGEGSLAKLKGYLREKKGKADAEAQSKEDENAPSDADAQHPEGEEVASGADAQSKESEKRLSDPLADMLEKMRKAREDFQAKGAALQSGAGKLAAKLYRDEQIEDVPATGSKLSQGTGAALGAISLSVAVLLAAVRRCQGVALGFEELRPRHGVEEEME